jgi:hypothetical protein
VAKLAQPAPVFERAMKTGAGFFLGARSLVRGAARGYSPPLIAILEI